MTIYGKAAVLATKMQHDGECGSPIAAWSKAVKMATKSKHSQVKVCPRNAYLGLCSMGLVRGVSRGEYTNSKENSEYAVEIVILLNDCSESTTASKSEMWSIVAPGVAHNGQMDVALALWEEDLIDKSNIPK